MIADRRIPRLFAMFNCADCDALEKRHIPSNDSIRIYSYHPWMNEPNTPPHFFEVHFQSKFTPISMNHSTRNDLSDLGFCVL